MADLFLGVCHCSAPKTPQFCCKKLKRFSNGPQDATFSDDKEQNVPLENSDQLRYILIKFDQIER